jgi:hypothetical protein
MLSVEDNNDIPRMLLLSIFLPFLRLGAFAGQFMNLRTYYGIPVWIHEA